MDRQRHKEKYIFVDRNSEIEKERLRDEGKEWKNREIALWHEEMRKRDIEIETKRSSKQWNGKGKTSEFVEE